MAKDKNNLDTKLESFTLRHQSHHRPIAIVTSGGTTAHLEQNSIRFLDNFSTGQRGAASVECLLQRGYAVIHLWRKGSASPYARTVSKKLGIKVPNLALDNNALDYLFYDPDANSSLSKQQRKEQQHQHYMDSHSYLALHPRLSVDEEISSVLRARSKVQRSGLLMTVPFESVEDYLFLLQKCSEAVKSYNGMVMIYLAAAVSDFWIPLEHRSVHKMDSSLPNSSSSSEPGILALKLYPVPKVIGTLRKEWAPNAFCVSFKLETDEKILEKKMRRAVERYKVHMVIGNELHTRHDKVYILHKEETGATTTSTKDNADPNSNGDGTENFEVKKVYKNGEEQIEDPMIDFVIQKHFEYISTLNVSSTLGVPSSSLEDKDGIGSIDDFIKNRKKQMHTQLWYRRMKNLTLQLCGSLVGAMISYYISAALRKRIEGSHAR